MKDKVQNAYKGGRTKPCFIQKVLEGEKIYIPTKILLINLQSTKK